MDRPTLKAHFKTKDHKKRIKELKTEPYTIEESERAAGHGSYIAPKKRKVETQPMSDDEVNFEDEDVEMKNAKRLKTDNKEEDG